jgi:alpha-D-ribose 1-methylphosphonate 5-triphosphate synthase subunit PhnG
VDLAVAKGMALEECRSFCAQEAVSQARKDHDTLRRIEATRVDMETF